jgi:hypothetical protein
MAKKTFANTFHPTNEFDVQLRYTAQNASANSNAKTAIRIRRATHAQLFSLVVIVVVSVELSANFSETIVFFQGVNAAAKIPE